MITGMIFKSIRAKKPGMVEAYQVFQSGWGYLGELYLLRGGLDHNGVINSRQLRWSSGNGTRHPSAELAVAELLLRRMGKVEQ